MSTRVRAAGGSTVRSNTRGGSCGGATPRFASQLSHKYAQLNVRAVQADLEQNHGRTIATSYIQNVAEWVDTIATAKEEDWEYAMPALTTPITTVVISRDGAMIPMVDEGQRAQWQSAHCTALKHDPAALDLLIGEAARLSQLLTMNSCTKQSSVLV